MKILAVAALVVAVVVAVALLVRVRSAGTHQEPEEDDSLAAGDYGPIVSEYRIGRVSAAIH